MYNHYIYLLRDPRNGRPFYIGKGKGRRYKDHFQEVISRKNTKSRNFHKINLIKQIHEDGYEPTVEFIIKNINEFSANILERKYISLYGRNDLNKGPLTNMTDGGEGLTGWTEKRKISHGNKKKKLILVKDRNENTFTVSKDDPRWLNGELVGINKGKMGVSNNSGKLTGYILAKDSHGNHYRIKKDDPRWISGELVGINKGIAASENVIKAAKARKGNKRSPEAIEKGASKIRGKSKSEEHKKKLKESITNLPKINCLHCNKMFSPGGYAKHIKANNC